MRAFAICLVVLALPTLTPAQSSPQGTSQAVVPQPEASSGASTWSTTLFVFSGVETSVLEEGSAAVSGNGYLALTKRLSRDTRFSIRPQYIYNTAGFNRFDENLGPNISAGDLYFQYSNYRLAEFGPTTLSWSQRLYLPTSEFSQTTRMIARTRAEFILEREFENPWILSYVFKGDYYLQSQRAYLDKKTKKREDGLYVRDPRGGNREWTLEHYLETTYKVVRDFHLKAQAGFDEEWRFGSEEEQIEGLHSTELKASVGFQFFLGRAFDATLNWQNKAPLRKGYSFGRPKDNSLIALTYFRF